jgi:dienelactone hydrolase
MKNPAWRVSAAAFAAVLLLACVAFGQKLVASELNGTMPAATVAERMRAAYQEYAVELIPADVELFKVRYTSLDANGKPAELTGLAAFPKGGAPKGLVVYCHGTTVDRRRSPSKFNGTGEAPETVEAITGFATGGYAVVLPDYIGLGDHKAAHPYPLAKVNARSAIDLIPAARELAAQKKYSIGKALYVTGYSEGGAVAMAMVQALQPMQGEMYDVKAAAPASGPYDLSGTTREFMLMETDDQVGFILRLYLLSYATNYLADEKKLRWRDVFKPALANALAINYGRQPTDDGVIKNIGITTALMRSKNRLENVLQPKFITSMRNNDARNPFVRALRDNDVFDWTPRVPMLLINLKGDTVVDPKNSEVAYNAMRKRGVGDNVLRREEFFRDGLNHVNAIATAMSFARSFFDHGFEARPKVPEKIED